MTFRFAGSRVVCFSTADWDTALPTNKHQLMRRLASRGARVLYLETLGTRAPKLSHGVDLGRIGRRLKRSFEGPQKREPRLHTLSPLVRPAWKSMLQIETNKFLFSRQVSTLRAKYSGDIVWVYSPFAIYLLDEFKPRFVIYHMVDDLSAVPGADVEALREAELLLLARADLVFCTEQSLYDRARRFSRRAYYMPNVADYGHFAKPCEVSEESAARLSMMRSLPTPRIVFSGNIAPHKIDLPLILALAKQRTDWSFVLIGPQWEGAGSELAPIKALEELPNVRLLGHISYDDLPSFLHEADALVIPYVMNDATRAVFPLKFFEYLATGKPLVSSPLPSLMPYRGIVEIAESKSDWEEALERCLADPMGRRKQRRALARRHTWERRLADMEAAIEKIQ